MPRDKDEQRIAEARKEFQGGKLETAARIAADVLADAPGNLDALEVKALVEIELGNHAAAEETLRSVIAIAPQRRWPHADLTRLLLKVGRTEDAERAARAALVADPDNPDAHAMLGSALVEREMLVAAATHFERAIALAGRHPDLLLGLGRVLLRQGRLDAARPLLQAAAAANPDALEPVVLLAELEERCGQFDAAMCRLNRAEPLAAAAGTDVRLQRSVLLERMGKVEEALELLQGEAELSGAALLQRGRLYDQLAQHPQAWRDWVAGKTILAERAKRHYPAVDVERQAHALAQFFDESQVAALPRAARRTDVPQPIFILGFPRSGTTLTEQILASHSAIRAGGELPFGRELRDFAVSLVGGEADFPRGLARINSENPHWAAQLRDFYLTRADAFGLTASGVTFFIDKMPLNEMWLPLLRIAFPESPMVLVRRHPLDVLISVMAHDMTHGFHCAYRLEDAARHLSIVDWLTARYGAAGFDVTHELRYETMVSDQRDATERLMRAIGLSMEPAQLHFHERATVSPTPSYAQVGEPLNDRSIGRWHNYAVELEPARPFLSDAMARGNYTARKR